MIVITARLLCPVYLAVPPKWSHLSAMKNMAATANKSLSNLDSTDQHIPSSPVILFLSSITPRGLSSSCFLLWKCLDWWVIGCCWGKDRLEWVHSLLQDWGMMNGGLNFHSCSSWHPSPPETPPDIYIFCFVFLSRFRIVWCVRVKYKTINSQSLF